MDEILNKIKNTRILGAVGLGIMFIATFLPYIVASIFGFSSSVSLFGYWEGKVTLLVCFANLLFVFKDYVKKYVPQLFNSNIGKAIENAKPIFSLIPTGVAVLLNIILMARVSGYSYIHFGIGFYVMIIGIACMIAYAILYKEPASEDSAAPAEPAAPAEDNKPEEPTDSNN